MLAAVMLLLAGAVVLTAGAEFAVRGAGRTSRYSPFVLGALLFGIDLESLGAALTAAGRGQTQMAAGESFGTIAFLLSVGLGAAVLLTRSPVPAPSPAMVLYPAATLLVGALAIADQRVSRPEALGLLAVYGVYVSLVVQERPATSVAALDRHPPPRPAVLSRLPAWVLLVGGLALVYLGATVLVEGGVRLLARTALSPGFVGAAVIGALAGADEILLEVIPVRRGMPQLATGNLFGTVAAFSTGVLGLAALVRPLEIDTAAGSAFLAGAVLYAVVATVFLGLGRVGRPVGVAVLALYAGWVVYASRI